MDKIEAKNLLEEFLQELKARPFLELQELLGNPVCIEREGPSGVTYQIEYEGGTSSPGETCALSPPSTTGDF